MTNSFASLVDAVGAVEKAFLAKFVFIHCIALRREAIVAGLANGEIAA